MAVVGWHPAPTQQARDRILGRAQALQALFGREHANRMLVTEPSLLSLTERRVRHNFEGLIGALQLAPVQATTLVRGHPTLLRSSPALLAARRAMLRELLELDGAALSSFLLRAPDVLRLPEGRLAAHMAWLQEAGGVSRARVVRSYRSWPQLTTTSKAVLQDRHRTLQRLLGASRDEMRHVCATYPNLLARDPGALRANAASLVALLGEGEEHVRALLIKEPGLLSYNMMTLATRWSYVMQVLRLPRKLGTTLLTSNRPLLSIITQLPERVDALRRLLKVTDDELYPLLHKHTPILRYPTAHAAAKLAVTGALASLNPAWAAAWERGGPFHAVRVIMASWGCVYRLAFLVATGQAGSTTLFAALRATHAAFTRDYPDYAAWLDGYNAAVGPDWAVPISGCLMSPRRAAPEDGSDAPERLVKAGGGGASVWAQQQPQQWWQDGTGAAGLEGEGGRVGACRVWQQRSGGLSPDQRPERGGGLEASSSGDRTRSGGASDGGASSSAGTGSHGGRSSRDLGPGAGGGEQLAVGAQELRKDGVVEAALDSILASWLGLPRPQVAQLLAEWPPLAKLTWAEWRSRADAAEMLLAVTGHSVAPAHAGRAGEHDGGLGSSSSSCGGGGIRQGAVFAGGGSGGGSSGSEGGGGDSGEGGGGRGSDGDCSGRGGEGDSSQSFADGHGPAMAAVVAASTTPQAAFQLGASAMAQELGSTLAPCPAVAARARALLAAPGGVHPAVPTVLAAAANLAPFSPALWRPPSSRAGALIGALLASCPSAWASELFVPRYRWLCALAAASPSLLEDLRAMPLAALAKAPLAPRQAYGVLQYLVAERAPRPWFYPAAGLLTRPPSWVPPPTFKAAYPGFEGWWEGIRNGATQAGAAALL